MKQSYPTKGIDPASYNGQPINISLAYFKQLSDMNAVQTEITLKPEGLRVTLIKKYPDTTVKKRKIECDNKELQMFQMRFQEALRDVMTPPITQQPMNPMMMGGMGGWVN